MTHSHITYELGRRLRRRRRILNLTQQDVGAIIGITFQSVQKFEQGTIALSVQRLFEFAYALETTHTVLLEGLELPREQEQAA